MDDASDQSSTSGEGIYAVTTREQVATQVDATDEFTVIGLDPDDVEFGIAEVELTGEAANHGTTLERTVYTSDKRNALGCHYLQETGTELKGPWTQSTGGDGSIRFSDDGSYTITIGASGDPATGEMPDLKLPKRLWETFTILEGAAKDCPPPGTSEVQDTEGPIIGWASSLLGSFEGSLNPASPGSVVEGTTTVQTTLPDATATVTWHLVHDGPILLPHD